MEMSPADMELRPWLHLDRGARTKKNGSGWAWGLAQSGLEHCEGTLFSNLIFEIKLQSQSEFFSNIIISTKCQYSSEVSQEGGVVIDDYAGVS